MPNWVQVNIAIHLQNPYDDTYYTDFNQATRQQRWEVFNCLKRHIEEYDNDELDNGFMPFEMLRPNPANKWSYNWCCENWGTKWDLDCNHHEVSPDGRTIFLHGQTAWSAPIKLVTYLCEYLGFDIECQYLSWENCEWGFYLNTEEEHFELSASYLEVDDKDDRVATTIKEMIDSNPNLDMSDILWKYLGCDEVQPEWEHLNCEWLVDETEHESMCIDEKFGIWQVKWDDHVNKIRELKHKILELIESLLEDNRMDEGLYLRTCNAIKNTTDTAVLEDIVGFFERFCRPSMLNYYHKMPEPELIKMYAS
jgi:hypothetical protein